MNQQGLPVSAALILRPAATAWRIIKTISRLQHIRDQKNTYCLDWRISCTMRAF